MTVVVAGTLAWQIAKWLGAQRPVFATLVPLVAIKDDPFSALNLSLSRMIGVIAGVLVGFVVLAAVGPSTLAIALLIAIGLIVGSFVRIGPSVNGQVAVSALLVLLASSNAGGYAIERIWETLVGVAVCTVVAPLLFPPNPVRAIERAVAQAEACLLADLATVRGLFERRSPRAHDFLAETTVHARTAVRAGDDIAKAQSALRFNIRRRASLPQLALLGPRLDLLGRLSIQMRRLARDAGSFSERDDRREQWDLAAAHLPAVAEAIAEAIRLKQLPQRASALLGAYRADDNRAVAAILRRPFVLMIDELDTASRE